MIDLAERLRNDLNYEVDKNLDKEKIAQIAIENYDLVKEYIDIVEKRNPNSFGELMKTTLRYVWYELSKDIATNNRFSFGEVTNDDSFFQKTKNLSVISRILLNYALDINYCGMTQERLLEAKKMFSYFLKGFLMSIVVLIILTLRAKLIKVWGQYIFVLVVDIAIESY